MAKKKADIVLLAGHQPSKPSARGDLDRSIHNCAEDFRKITQAGKLAGDDYILSSVLGAIMRLLMEVMSYSGEGMPE